MILTASSTYSDLLDPDPDCTATTEVQYIHFVALDLDTWCKQLYQFCKYIKVKTTNKMVDSMKRALNARDVCGAGKSDCVTEMNGKQL